MASRIKEVEMIEKAKEIIRENIKSLELTESRIDENFERAVEVVRDARKVIVSGIGKSGLIARKIAATMTSMGIRSVFLHPVEALHGDLGIAEEGDVAILLSKSGTTEELSGITPYIRKRGIKIISILGNTEAHLAQISDIVLDGGVEREACLYNVAPTTSTLVALALGDALAVCAMKARENTLEDFAKNHPKGQLGKNLTIKVKDVMHKGDDIPIVKLGSSFRESMITMTEKKLGCCCCVNDRAEFSGIITDGDVRRALQRYDEIKDLKVEDVMTKNAISIGEDLFLGEALAVMEERESQIAVLPVIDEAKRCRGVIRLHDIVRSKK